MRALPSSTNQAQSAKQPQLPRRSSQSLQEKRDSHANTDIDVEDDSSESEQNSDLESAAQQHAEFYDSQEDERDEAWVQQQRQGRRSDAVLSCPGCLTTVCIDCQRHDFITTQYRAMFVTNCRVSNTPKPSTASKPQKASGKRQRDSEQAQLKATSVQDQVFAVFCQTCDAELGVQDTDEVFHFFSAFPSTA